ncbi:MAG: hypothetical protein GXO00_02550 [Candidatus Diapherotrites archaeon]|nr:hypothetical protein [Candidatus Diapherotrites archaeon]
MNLGEKISAVLSYIPYGVAYGIIFASPLAGAISYLGMTILALYLLDQKERRWRHYAVTALAGFLLALATSLLSKSFSGL